MRSSLHCLQVLCALAFLSQTLASVVVTRAALKYHLDEAFDINRYHGTQKKKDGVYAYIYDFFVDLAEKGNGFVENQTYTIDLKTGETDLPGINAILTLKGSRWGTSEDRVSILGAHFDSQVATYGVDDNGSGMAAMLETAKAVANIECDRLNSVIFVAFDWEEFGLFGSARYVQDHLVPYVLAKYDIDKDTYRGTFVMDTILNYDPEPYSQILPSLAELVFPRLVRWVKERDYKGDFLATIGRRDDAELLASFAKHWNETYTDEVHKTGPYLQLNVECPFTGNPSKSWIGRLIRDFFRSDHYEFWDYSSNYTDVGLKAVFLTDTANFRGYMEKCYHNWCDDMAHVTDERLDFLRITTTTLSNMYTEFATESMNCGS